MESSEILQLDTTSNSVFAHKFSKLKTYLPACYNSSVYFNFRYHLLSNNNSKTNDTVKTDRRCLDLLNYTVKIAFNK